MYSVSEVFRSENGALCCDGGESEGREGAHRVSFFRGPLMARKETKFGKLELEPGLKGEGGT